MGDLKSFFRNVPLNSNVSAEKHQFSHISPADLESHLAVKRYKDFLLTDAVRPSFDLKVMPRQGFRRDRYVDPRNGATIPVLMISVSKNMLFETFMDLLEPLGDCVDIVLETSHSNTNVGHVDLYREQMDLPVFKSNLYDFEDMLTNDGCSGIAVLNPYLPIEIQLDEHKLILIYGQQLSRFEAILQSNRIYLDKTIRFITEAEHVHLSKDSYADEFASLQTALGMDRVYC